MKTDFSTNKKDPSKQKTRGGYYTPLQLTKFLTDWAIRTGQESILEPSCGDGNFLSSIVNRLQELSDKNKKITAQIDAVEIEKGEISKAKKRITSTDKQHHKINWFSGDFFDYFSQTLNKKKFDVVLGNPPFIRFQYFDPTSRDKAFKFLREFGYKPTKLANAWSAFLQLSIELLNENGRLAMVVPAELLQVKYAHELRQRLSRMFEHIVLVCFKRLVFPEIQQEVVLLLAEGKRNSLQKESDIHTVEFDDGSFLKKESLEGAIAHIPAKHSRPDMKWTSLFLKKSSYEAIECIPSIPKLEKLSKYADVDVGVVTGRNKFFILTKEQVDQYSAHDYCVPVVGKTSALKSLAFQTKDIQAYSEQYPAYLLNLKGISRNDLPPSLLEYIVQGEEQDVHKGYKCRIRSVWYQVPSIHIPDAFLYRQIYRFPLLTTNQANATSTDTIHRVRMKNGTNPKWLSMCMFNSLTLTWAEICGRSYGGGVLELEPSEAEELPVFYSEDLPIDFEKLNKLILSGDYTKALNYTDRIILKDALQLKDSQIKAIRNAGEELRTRRIGRK